MSKGIAVIICTGITLGMAQASLADTPTSPASTTITPTGNAATAPAHEGMLGRIMGMLKHREALEACKGKSAGQACSFEGHKHNTVNGTCKQTQNGKAIVCRREKAAGADLTPVQPKSK
jgi:hypothetical protein